MYMEPTQERILELLKDTEVVAKYNKNTVKHHTKKLKKLQKMTELCESDFEEFQRKYLRCAND